MILAEPGTTTRRWLSSLCIVASVLILSLATCKPSHVLGIRPGTLFVAARDSLFAPDTITVTVGFPVRWTNEGAVLHSVVSDSGRFASGLLQPNAWFEVRFDSAGTFPYHCSQHAGMVGTVVAVP
jgi:plastocyanin